MAYPIRVSPPSQSEFARWLMIYHMSIKKTVLDEKEVDKRAQDMMSAGEYGVWVDRA